MIARSLSGVVLMATALSGCAYEQSFKTVTVEGIEREKAFAICEKVVVAHYQGTRIRTRPEEGKIETDPVEFMTEAGTRREQVYVDLTQDGPDRITVALFAPISEMIIDPDAEPAVYWRVKGSDVTQEERLIEEILARVLREAPEARVVEE